MTPAEPFPRAEFAEMFSNIAELPPAAVVWDNQGLPFVGQMGGKPGFWIELSVTSIRAKGVDDQRYTYNPDPTIQANDLLQYGYRVVTVQVKVTSNNSEIPSFDIMERLRRRLRSLTAKTVMQEVDTALVKFMPSVDLPKEADNRTKTSSVMDILFGWMVTEDPGDDSGNWIETATPIKPSLS